MDSGYYAAFAGLKAKTAALDVAANNLANASTVGYKARQEFYRSLGSETHGRSLSPLNRAVNDFAVLGGASTDLRPGTLQPTGNDLDLALEGSGFFAVQTEQGIRYTRNGSFHVGPSKTLVTQEGQQVLDGTSPIQISGGPVAVSADGTMSINGAVVAHLNVVDFPPGTELTPEGASYFSAPAGAAQPAANSAVRQGFVEASNLNPITGAVALVFLQRHSEMLMRALSIFHTEFNKTAVEELAKV